MKASSATTLKQAEKFIPWWEPSLGAEEQRLVLKVLESNYLNDGEVTEEFERRLARFCGAAHAVGVTSGTAGIFLSLAACGIRPGDEVIIPDITFVATANAVKLAGAKPVLVDVCPENFSLEPDQVTKAITLRTKAIVPVHVNGRAADMETILSLAKKKNLMVVEDAAETLGATWHGKSLGTIGHAGALSFASSKLITTGQGGAVLTNDEKTRNRVKELKDHGRLNTGTGGADQHPVVGYNFKLTNLQSAVGLAQLGKLPDRLLHLKRLTQWYREELDGVKGINLVPFDLKAGHQPQWIDCLCDKRDELAEFLLKKGIQTRKFWFPIHTLPPYRADAKRFPNALRVSKKGLWLPSSISLTKEDLLRVTGTVKEFFRTKG